MTLIPSSLINEELYVEINVLEQLRDLLAKKSFGKKFVFIPTVYNNISDPRKELIIICSCMQNNNNIDVQKLYDKYAKMSFLAFLELTNHLPCSIKTSDAVINGKIMGVNKNKEFAVIMDNNQQYVVRIKLRQNSLFGGRPSLSDTVTTTSNTVKSKNIIHSTGAGYSAGSSDNYFSESTSGAEDGLCE